MRRFWTDEEKAYLGGNYTKVSPKVCAKALNRSVSSIYQQAKIMGLCLQVAYSPEELAAIKTHYDSLGPDGLSKILHRTRVAIKDTATRLGLHVSPERRVEVAKFARAQWSKETLRKKSEECKQRKGALSPSWKGGNCTLSEMSRSRLDSCWEKYVLQRDQHTCKLCGAKHERMSVHHVKKFTVIRDEVVAAHPELDANVYEDRDRLAVLIVDAHRLEDGVTLCLDCHKRHHFENGVNCGNIFNEDNPQPSLPNVVSIVSKKVQRLTVEDTTPNKTDTSAPAHDAHHGYEIVRTAR